MARKPGARRAGAQHGAGGAVRGAAGEAVVYALVDTAWGAGLVASRGGRVVASFLPDGDAGALRRRLLDRFPGAREAPAGDVAGADAFRRWAAGEAVDPAGVPVELPAGGPFRARVYRALRAVRAGRTVTYAELARRAGSPGAHRSAGSALARNPTPPFVPCHRVLGSDGGLHGFSAPGGVGTKARLLAMEAGAAGGGGGAAASVARRRPAVRRGRRAGGDGANP